MQESRNCRSLERAWDLRAMEHSTKGRSIAKIAPSQHRPKKSHALGPRNPLSLAALSRAILVAALSRRAPRGARHAPGHDRAAEPLVRPRRHADRGGRGRLWLLRDQ